MKKLICIVLSVMVIAAMAIPASAAYVYKPVNLPSIPSFSVDVDVSDAVKNYLKENPVNVSVLPAPKISSVRFTHAGSAYYMKSVFDVRWDAVVGAESYEVLVTKADGTEVSFTSTSNSLYKRGLDCFKVYCEETSTWKSATVKVRAVAEGKCGLWSEPVALGCGTLHIA